MVSVVVLTYNQEQTIGRTLDSILSQKSDYSFEIIVGEDASPSDNTRAVCESYAAKHPQLIRLLPKAPNKGLMRNYADCLAECSGKYIACCAGDDWWHNPNKLQMQVDFLEANADYGVVHTDCDTFIVSKSKIIKSDLTRRTPEGEVHVDLYKMCFVIAPTVMFRRNLLQYIDFEEFMRLNFAMEDYPMWLEMSRHCKFHYINQSTVTYSLLDNSVSHSDDIDKRLKFIEASHFVQNHYYQKYKPTLPTPLSMTQNRTCYMVCFEYDKYGRSFRYVSKLGFSPLLRFVLHTYLGSWLCKLILNSSYYKHYKGF